MYIRNGKSFINICSSIPESKFSKEFTEYKLYIDNQMNDAGSSEPLVLLKTITPFETKYG
jgi:hypothetical protein